MNPVVRAVSAGPTVSAPWQARILTVVVGLSSFTVMFEPRDRQHALVGVLEGSLILLLAFAGALLVDDDVQEKNGVLLGLVGASLAVEHLHLIDNSPFPLMGWIAGPLAAVLVAIVLVRFPATSLSRRGHRWAVAATSLLVISRLTVSVPPRHLRLGWWPVLPLPSNVAEIGLTLGNVYLLVLAAWFVGLMVWRVRRNSGLARHELAPVVMASLGAALTVAAHVGSVFTGQTQVGIVVLVIEQIGLLAIPAGFIYAALEMRSARGAVGQLVLGVRGSSTPAELQSALAATLSDPRLTLFVWAPEEGHWRTASGEQRDPEPRHGDLVVPVDGEDGHPLAVIVTDASVARHGELVDASAAAVRLALQNAAVMGMLRRSRTRLAEAELAERKRLERDLHDGVQQRLLSVGMSMDRVLRAAPDQRTKDLATTAAEEVQEAIKELRDLARGILPAVLTQSGLAAAVESAAERLPLLITSTIPRRRWHLGMEATAYFVICEALNNVVKHAHSDRAEVEVVDDPHVLRIRVEDFGRGGADTRLGTGLLGLHDRVTALGGSLRVESEKGVGTCLTAELPYE